MKMTKRQEEIEKASRERHLEKYNQEGFCPDFTAGAEWADAHPDKQSIVKYLRELGYTVTLNGDVITRDQEIKDMEQYVKYQKEKLIEKAIEWLEPIFDKYEEIMDRDVRVDFKQAMMEE